MAASIIAAPGSNAGPCIDVACAHTDCRQTRRDAATLCRFCAQPIGYDRLHYRARLSGALAHAQCLDESVERHDARVGEF